MVFNSTSCYYRTSENQNLLVPNRDRKKKEEKQIGDIWRQPETSVTQLMNYRLKYPSVSNHQYFKAG